MTTLLGDPEPMECLVSVYGEKKTPDGIAHGALLFYVWAKTAKSAWELVLDAPQYGKAEVAYFAGFGPGVPPRVWRDAVSRQWRSK